jgi:teichuronic acid biosynthesis glycosyltransferase TuaC
VSSMATSLAPGCETMVAPRVLFVIPGEDAAGSSMVFARRQAAALMRAGAQVDTFYLSSRTSPARLAAEFWRFRAWLRSTRPNVVHAHFGTVTSLFAALASGTTPLVITYRGSDLNPTPGGNQLRAALGRLFSQMAALRARRIVCVSRQLRERLWWRRGSVTVLPSGVDPGVFRPQSRIAARAALGWLPQERVILFNAGHDPRNKRLDLAKAAVEIAAQQLEHVRLEILVGQTDPELIPLAMNAADCLLVTSDAEGSPTVVQEALASNLPIVGVAVGDIPERIAGVRHALIAEREPTALGAALVEILRTPVRSNGRDHVLEFSSLRIAQELCRLYREIDGL